jgi:heme/copper-type cytochrome/quinol oxidase subunit 2
VHATFEEPGTYVLRCRADDGALVADEEVTIVVVR